MKKYNKNLTFPIKKINLEKPRKKKSRNQKKSLTEFFTKLNNYFLYFLDHHGIE